MTIMLTRAEWRLFALIAFLYMTQGIPLGLAMETLPTLLRQDGVSLQWLALLPLVGLPWILKFLWAPMVDNVWSTRFGKRRSWIIPMQSVVLLCLLLVAAIGLTGSATPVALALFALSSLASATQDTATDGLTAENVYGPALARANAVQVGGTMVGFFVGGSGCLILSGLFGRTVALLVVAAIVGVGLMLALLWREPDTDRQSRERTRASLVHLIRRRGAGAILALALLTAVAASSTFALFKLLLVDRSWPLEKIGTLGMAGGVATIVIGCGAGAWLINRAGIRFVLICGLACLALSAALWIRASASEADITQTMALIAVVAGSIGSGSVSVALMTLAMAFAQQGDQAGTDMTGVQSTRDLGEMGGSSFATFIAASFGYGAAFGVALLLAFCGALMSLRTKREMTEH